MNRVIFYPDQQPTDSDFLKLQRNAMVALGHLAQGAFGTDPIADGLPCAPTSPASMAVTVGPGTVTAYTAIDDTAFGTLDADANPIVKLGLRDSTSTYTLTPPTTPGQSVKYLIQAAYDENDTDAVVLSYYNAADPDVPYSGPGDAGTSQNTTRATQIAVEAKRGTPATTGLESVPAVSSGYLPLWIITVAYGQTTVTSGNIVEHPDAPWVSKLTDQWAPIDSPVFTGDPTCPTPATANSIANRDYVDGILDGAGVATAATPDTIAKRDGSGGLTAVTFTGQATTALYANTAGFASTANSASTADNATYATSAGTATSAASAATANTAALATNATTANTAAVATTATKLDNKLPSTSATADTVAVRDSGGNLAATNFNGTATSAKFADLAERFEASEVLAPGDVVDLGGLKEIKKATTDFLGVISAQPAFRMNEDAGDDLSHPFVAYAGRVPVKVVGSCRFGDYLVLSPIPGVAMAGLDKSQAIGRCLESKSYTGVSLILAVVLAK